MTDYNLIIKQIKSITSGVDYEISNLSNISALLYDSIENLNWVGFYYNVDNKLLLGPFQGKVACTLIEYGKGVCSTSLKNDEVMAINNVHEFKGHIACDSASNSEIVLPIHKNNEIYALLDIDSPLLNRFSNEDIEGLKAIRDIIEECLGN